MIARVGLAIALCAGCQRDVDQRPAIEPAAEPAWRAKLVADRADNDRAFKTDVDSPLAGSERFTPTATTYVAVDDHGLRLDAQPSGAMLASFAPIDGAHWKWQPAAEDVTATSVDGKRPLPPGAMVEPTLIRLTSRYAVKAQVASTAFVVTAYDAERPQIVAFRALSYFDPDARFVVRAVLDRLAVPTPIELATSRDLTKPFVHIGTLRFELEGARLSLERSGGSLVSPA